MDNQQTVQQRSATMPENVILDFPDGDSGTPQATGGVASPKVAVPMGHIKTSGLPPHPGNPHKTLLGSGHKVFTASQHSFTGSRHSMSGSQHSQHSMPAAQHGNGVLGHQARKVFSKAQQNLQKAMSLTKHQKSPNTDDQSEIQITMAPDSVLEVRLNNDPDYDPLCTSAEDIWIENVLTGDHDGLEDSSNDLLALPKKQKQLALDCDGASDELDDRALGSYHRFQFTGSEQAIIEEFEKQQMETTQHVNELKMKIQRREDGIKQLEADRQQLVSEYDSKIEQMQEELQRSQTNVEALETQQKQQEEEHEEEKARLQQELDDSEQNYQHLYEQTNDTISELNAKIVELQIKAAREKKRRAKKFGCFFR